MVSLGRERTIDQDPAFALRILVDIAIRALSPAVNDPTTATQVLNHIDALLLGIGSSDRAFRGSPSTPTAGSAWSSGPAAGRSISTSG